MSEESKYVVKVMLGIGKDKECAASSEEATLEDAEELRNLILRYYENQGYTKQLYDIVIVRENVKDN